MFSPSLLLHLFLSLCCFCFQFWLFSSLSCYPPFTLQLLFLFILGYPYEISPFYPYGLPTIFVWLLGHHQLWACLVPSLPSTTHSMTSSNSFGSVMSPSLSLGRIRPWVSHYLPPYHASSGLSHLLPILSNDVIPTKHLPELKTWNRSFSPLHQTTPSVNLLIESPPPMLAGYKLVVLRS